MNTKTTLIRVWDIPTRLFHWSLVVSFCITFVTSESEKLRDIHVTAGYAIAGLIVFRLLWGIIGNRYARFTNFIPTPHKLLNYLKSLTTENPQHFVGHNPAGAVAILLLLTIGLVSTASGWAVYEDIGGYFVEELHESTANFMLLIVGIHITGVVVSSWLHRENLVKAILTGYKREP